MYFQGCHLIDVGILAIYKGAKGFLPRKISNWIIV